MLASMGSIGGEGILVYANVLLQLTFFSLVSIVLASCYRNNAVLRYSILYTSLLSLTLLCVVSIASQSRNSSFLLLQLETPTDYFDYLLPQLDGLFVTEPGSASTSYGSIGGFGSASVPAASFIGNALFFIANLPYYLIAQMLWLSGFLVSTVGLLRSLHNADRIAGRSQKLKIEERNIFNSIMDSGEFSDSTLQCRESAEIVSPVLVGIIDPVLLVPQHFFEHFSESDIRAILRHEVAHVTRRDPLFNFLQKIILSLFWFHPFVHYMDRMIVRAREEICDNYVLAEQRATDYGDVLLRLSLSQPLHAVQCNRASNTSIGLGVISSDWNLEQRISDLLNQKREKLMRLSQRSKILLNVSVVAMAFAVSACQVTAQDDVSPLSTDATTAASQSPDNTVYPTLGPQIQAKISEIQNLMIGGSDSEPDWEGAKVALDELREERFERMNAFEKQTLLNFYTNYYLSQENYAEAIRIFEEILELDLIRPDVELRVFRSLGQLYAAREYWSDSIRYYEEWQANSGADDRVVFHGLSYAHYQLEQFDDALPNWLSYMDMKSQEGEELVRDDYSYLVGLHYTLENWTQALDVSKEMTLLFNTSKDWENLRAIFRKMDEAEQSDAA